MYEHLRGKTLLIMDRTALAACAVQRARELGIKTVVANFYKYEDSPSKQLADIKIDIDISNIDAMVGIVREHKVDGIFIGWTDSHLPYYAKICERTNLPCCGTLKQFDVFSNDKRKFKAACEQFGVPTVPSFQIDKDLKKDDLEKITYPVVIKPADGSGGRGVELCKNEDELREKYMALYKSSKSKRIICEKYIDSPLEIFLNYTIQDNIPSLSAAYMKHRALAEANSTSSGLLHIYPSTYIDRYVRDVEPLVINMFTQSGLKNTVLSLQGFVKDDHFYFHEAGLRMGGGQSYIFTQALNGISALDMLIEFALTGEMTTADVKTQDNCHFSQYCANYYIRLRTGTIASISGMNTVESMPQVLQCLSFHKEGDYIGTEGSVDRIGYRIHVMDKTKEALAESLSRISRTLRIISTKGEEMQVEHLTFDRALEMINKS